jgi:hypothetical protein
VGLDIGRLDRRRELQVEDAVGRDRVTRALSHGPPTQVSRRVVADTFVTTSVYASTEAPSPGVPDAAPTSVPDASVTSTVTTLSVATVSVTRWAPLAVAAGVVDGSGVGMADGTAVVRGVASGSPLESSRGAWPPQAPTSAVSTRTATTVPVAGRTW